jgi:hypothetical protein
MFDIGQKLSHEWKGRHWGVKRAKDEVLHIAESDDIGHFSEDG